MPGAEHNHNEPNDYNALNLHTHGFQASPQNPGDNVLISIRPGQRWEYAHDLPADHPPGFHWYHPHRHGSAAIQFLSGMAGVILVEGGLDEVPEIAAAVDELMVIQEIRLGADGLVAHFYDALAGINDHTFHLVNGQLEPTYTMAPGEVQRWRILNANARDYLLLSLDGHIFHVLSHDGITLPAPEQVSQMLLSPGERVECLSSAARRAATVCWPTPSAVASRHSGHQDAGQSAGHGRGDGSWRCRVRYRSRNGSEHRVWRDHGQPGVMEFGLIGHYVINGQTFDPGRVDYRVSSARRRSGRS